MLPQRIARASALRSASAASRRLPMVQTRSFLPESLNKRSILEEKYPDNPTLSEAEDPLQNGAYVNPPRVKRQFRDPHGDWWDKQERRNYGEPVHEDHDVLGMFTPYEYTWVSPGKGLLQIGAFILTTVGLCWTVAQSTLTGLHTPASSMVAWRELGGSGAMRARSPEDPEPFQSEEEE